MVGSDTMQMVTGVLLAIFCLAPSAWAESHRVEWPRGVKFPVAEKQEVLALAKEMGVDDPAKVWIGVVPILGDRFVTVDGRVSVKGHERRWITARIFRDNWRGPDDAPPPELRTHRVGRWISMGESETILQWRIQDGRWFVDVPLCGGVTYEDAGRIVLAIRRGTLLDRRSERPVNGASSRSPLPRVDGGRVTSIEREGSLSREYRVWYSGKNLSGYILHVRISEDQLELLTLSSFEV